MEKSADHEKQPEQNMAPKNDFNPSLDANPGEADLQEMQAVNESLDELSSALDFFEQRTDIIIEQLKELLNSNRAIREEIALEKASLSEGSGDAGKDTENATASGAGQKTDEAME